jgi:hypothetical protein
MVVLSAGIRGGCDGVVGGPAPHEESAAAIEKMEVEISLLFEKASKAAEKMAAERDMQQRCWPNWDSRRAAPSGLC